jgi:hypothetical protein
MKYIAHSIEQLDLAGQQLQTDNPSYARFTLLLTDNALELLLHDQCRHEWHYICLRGGCRKSVKLTEGFLPDFSGVGV